MSEFQLKITLHTKNQENLKLNFKRQSIGVNGEVGKMLGLSNEEQLKSAEKCFRGTGDGTPWRSLGWISRIGKVRMLGCSLAVKVLPGLCEVLGSIANIKRKEGRREGGRKGGRKETIEARRKWLRFKSKRLLVQKIQQKSLLEMS